MQYSIDEVLKIVDISKRTLYNNKDIMTDSECVQRKGNRNYFTQKAIDILKQRYSVNRSRDEVEETTFYFDDETEAKSKSESKENLELIKAEHKKELEQIALVFSGTIKAKDEVIQTLKDEHQKQIDLLNKQVEDLRDQVQLQNELLKKITEKKSIFQRIFGKK